MTSTTTDPTAGHPPRSRTGLLSAASGRLLGLIPSALTLTGCSDLGQLAWMRTLGAPVAWAGIVWTVGGALVGLAIAGLLLWWFRPRRTTPAGPIGLIADSMAALTLLTIVPCTVAFIAFFEGTLRASQHQLTDGAFAERYFPTIGDAGADLIGTVLLTGNLDSVLDDAAAAEAQGLRDAFRSGERQIEAAQIPALVAAIDGGTVREIAEGIQDDIVRTVPGFDSGARRQLLFWFMNHFSDALVRAALEENVERNGLGALNLFGRMIHELPDAATREGDPTRLSHRETAAFLAEVAMSDGVVRFVIRPFCRVHQLGALLPLVLSLTLPLVVLRRDRLSRRFRRRGGTVASSAPPDAG